MPLGKSVHLEISRSKFIEERTYSSKSQNRKHHLGPSPGEVIVFDMVVGGDKFCVWYQLGADMDGNRAILVPHMISGVEIEYPPAVLKDQIVRMVGLGL